jgi:hypothetical protein
MISIKNTRRYRPILREKIFCELSRRSLETFSYFGWQDDPRFKSNAAFQTEWFKILGKEVTDTNDPKLSRDILNFKETHRALILAPRLHGKTTCISVKYPIWRLGNNHKLRILIISKTARLATDILGEIRGNIEKNFWIKKIFPTLKPDSPWTGNYLTVKRPTIDKNPSIAAEGLHGSIIGKTCRSINS